MYIILSCLYRLNQFTVITIQTYLQNFEKQLKTMNEITQQQSSHYSQYDIQISDICSEVSYFVVLPYSHKELQLENANKRPVILTYRYPQITFEQLMKRYLNINKNNDTRNKLLFTLSKGYKIQKKSSVLSLKKDLRKGNLDGLVLFTVQPEEESEDSSGDSTDSDHILECGLMEFIGVEKEFQKQRNFTFHFILPNCKFVISVEINPSQKIETLIELFYKQVLKQFKLNLDKGDIKDFKLKKTNKSLKNHIRIESQRQLYDDSQIEVIMANKKINFIKKYQAQSIITIINNQNNQIKILEYGQVKNMKLSKMISQYFEKYNHNDNRNNRICLKVMEIIILPEEKINKLAFAIQRLKMLGNVKLVGYLLNEKMLFYKLIRPLVKSNTVKQFQITELTIPSESSYQRKQCQKKINQRLNTIQDSYFKDQNHIEPILVYTSNLKYVDQKTKQVNIIYDSLNKFLREDTLFKKTLEEIKNQWKYRYTSTLLLHLENIQGTSCVVYRGANFDLESQKGDKITFKPFLSTSKSKKVALRFALKDIVKSPHLPRNLYIMKILCGKPIDKLSYFSTEQQHLLQPYSQFLIIDRTEQQFCHPQFPDQQKYKFTVYYMQQLPSPKQIPQVANNYILWIDDKNTQGQQIFNKFIQQFHQPTVLFQIVSTKKLAEWISQRQNIIYDKSSQIIMVTNMVRTEDGVRNFYAGTQSISLIRESIPNIPIAVYVRDTNATNKNLNEKNIDRTNLTVISQFEELSIFIEKFIKVKFRSLVPVIPQEYCQSALNKEQVLIKQKLKTPEKIIAKSQIKKKSQKQKCQIQ